MLAAFLPALADMGYGSVTVTSALNARFVSPRAAKVRSSVATVRAARPWNSVRPPARIVTG